MSRVVGWRVAAIYAAVLVVAAGWLATASAFASAAGRSAHVVSEVDLPAGVQAACPPSGTPGEMACTALLRTDVSGGTGVQPAATPPPGFGPADLQGAYGLPSTSSGTRQTVAIVNAYDHPNAEADLAVYRSQYGLPACKAANGCFRKVDQAGGANYPAPNVGWGHEIALDLDIVSAACPNCRILLVEANSSSITDLGAAVNTAVALGARFVSNSYAGPEDVNNVSYDNTYFNHPGVAITVAAGDSGFGVNYPAASQYVTAVGGTTLTRTGTGWRDWSEAVWGQTSSGCSAYDPKPSWQHDTGCANRTVADVAAVADPATGVSYYNSFNAAGWLVGGGTSVGAPLVASIYALAGTPAATGNPAAYPYAGSGVLNDVRSGGNGTCSIGYLCTAGAGYDGPTGLGTPQGPMSFSRTGAVTGPLYSGLVRKCMDDYGGSTTNGNPIVIWTCNGTSAQSFAVQADGTIRIKGKCVNVYGNGTSNGSKLIIYTCNGAANEQWRVKSDRQLVNPISGRCIDDPGSSTTNGTQLIIYDCKDSNNSNQQWALPYSVPTATGPIVSGVLSTLCMDDYGGSTADGTKVQIWTCNGTAAQSWTIAADRTLRVVGLCLDVNGGFTTAGTRVQAWTCNGGGSQQWRIRTDGSLVNPQSGLCLDDPAASTLIGTQLQIWACNGTNAQSWNVPAWVDPTGNMPMSFFAAPAFAYDNGDSTMSIYRWGSTGSSFSSPSVYTSGSYQLSNVERRTATGDVDGDSRSDIVQAYQNGDGTFSFYVFLDGNTAGVWYTSGSFSLSNVAGRLVVGDFNGDGKAEPALVYDEGGTQRIFRWLSTGSSFTRTTDYVGTGSFLLDKVEDRVAAGDVNDDGSADIVEAYQLDDGTFAFYVFLGGLNSVGRWYTSGPFIIANVYNRLVLGYW